MEWQISFMLHSPALPVELMAIEDFYDHKGIDASVSALPDAGQWRISFGVETHSYREAMTLADHDLGMFGDGRLDEQVVAIEAMTIDELERRAAEPTMPELVGASEVAQTLNVSRQRVHQLREHEGFPAPLVEVAMGPLWDQRAIDKFNRGWTRTPGRPAARSQS